MGCLFDFIFEVVFTVIFEGILAIYMKLMTLLVPEHKFGTKLREKIRSGVAIFAILLFLCAIVGFLMYISPPSVIVMKTVGAYMFFISIGFMGVTMTAGIIYRIVKAIKNKHRADNI